MFRRSILPLIVVLAFIALTFSTYGPAHAAATGGTICHNDTYEHILVGNLTLAPGDTAALHVTSHPGAVESHAHFYAVGASDYGVDSASISYTNTGVDPVTTDVTILGSAAPGTMTTITWILTFSDPNSSFHGTGTRGNCPKPAAGAVTWCDLSADGRVDAAKCWNRLVPYCNIKATPPTVDFYGVDNSGLGLHLVKFNYSDVVAAGPAGVKQDLGNLGVVSVMVDAQNSFYAAWNGQVSAPSGNFYADGKQEHGFAVLYTCDFKR